MKTESFKLSPPGNLEYGMTIEEVTKILGTEVNRVDGQRPTDYRFCDEYRFYAPINLNFGELQLNGGMVTIGKQEGLVRVMLDFDNNWAANGFPSTILKKMLSQKHGLPTDSTIAGPYEKFDWIAGDGSHISMMSSLSDLNHLPLRYNSPQYDSITTKQKKYEADAPTDF